jgi:FkbM family methyltransferase
MIYKWIEKILEPLDNPYIIEAGAHIGTDTEKIMRMLTGKSFQYHLFEPDPLNIEVLERLIERKGWPIVLNKSALGNFDGMKDFYASRGHKEGLKREITDLGSLKEPIDAKEVHSWVKFEKISVKVERLNDYIKRMNWPILDFLWADLQGGELDMLEGASKVLGSIRYIYLEHSTKIEYSGQGTFAQINRKLSKFHSIYSDNYNSLFENKLWINHQYL